MIIGHLVPDHNLSDEDLIMFVTGETDKALPFYTYTPYYVSVVNSTTIQLSYISGGRSIISATPNSTKLECC